MSEHRVAQLEDRVGDLIARQGRGRDAAELTRYAADPVAFATEVLDFTPWSAQREMLAAVCDRPLVAVVGANAVGKDAALAALALWWVYACGGLVLLVSASQRQTSEILMRGEVSRLFRAGRLPGTLYTESLRLPDERAAIIAFTTSEMSRLGGYHGARLLVGVSEAQGVEDWAFEALLGCAVGQEDRVCLVGNAFFHEGLFFRAFR